MRMSSEARNVKCYGRGIASCRWRAVVCAFAALSLVVGLMPVPALTTLRAEAAAPRAGSVAVIGEQYKGKAEFRGNVFGANTSDAVAQKRNNTFIGPYQFNIAGNTNVRGKYDQVYNGTAANRFGVSLHGDAAGENAVGYTMAATTINSVTYQVGGLTGSAPRTNSSSAVLEPTAGENPKIVAAFVVFAATQGAGFQNNPAAAPLSRDGVSLKGPKGDILHFYPQTIYYDANNGGRASCFFDVTDFVKEQGYGTYSGINIPATLMSSTATGSDYFGAWKLIVVEENAALPTRMLRLMLGGAEVSPGVATEVEISGDGLSVAPNTTGEFLFSVDGSDFGDNSAGESLKYTTYKGGTVVKSQVSLSRAAAGDVAERKADLFYSFQIDKRGKRIQTTPGPNQSRVGFNGATSGFITQYNTDFSLMEINDGKPGSMTLDGSETKVVLSAYTASPPMLISALGLAVDIKVPKFESKIIVSNLTQGYSSDSSDYNPKINYAQEGDRLRAAVYAENKSVEQHLGLENSTFEIEVPCFKSIDYDPSDTKRDIIARFKSQDGTEDYELKVVSVDGNKIVVQTEKTDRISKGGYFEVIFEGEAKGSTDYVSYDNRAALSGIFVDESDNAHPDSFMENLGLAYTVTASDRPRYAVNLSVEGPGKAALSGAEGAEVLGGNLLRGTETARIAMTPNSPDSDHYTKLVMIDGAVRDDLAAAEGFDLSMDGREHEVLVLFSAGERPSPEFCTIATRGDAGVSFVTETTRVAAGSDFSVQWKVAPGYRISEVRVDGYAHPDCEAGGLSFKGVQSDHSVEVITAPKFARITTMARGGGDIDQSQAVTLGEDCSITWRAQEGKELAYVYVDGELVYDCHRFEVDERQDHAPFSWKFDAVAGDHVVEVVFDEPSDVKKGTSDGGDPDDPSSSEVAETFRVTTQLSGGNGSISPSVQVNKNGSATVAWAPSDGYSVSKVIVTRGALREEVSAASGSCTLSNITSDCTVQVVLTRNDAVAKTTYTVQTSMVGGPGTITGTMADIEPGDEVEAVGWTAGEGWKVLAVHVDGVPRDDLLSKGAIDFGKINGNHTVVVSVQRERQDDDPRYHTITVTCEGDGTAGQSASVATGAAHSVSWSPNVGAKVLSVLVDGIEYPDFATDAGVSRASALGIQAGMRGIVPAAAFARAATASYRFADIQVDHTVHVKFSKASGVVDPGDPSDPTKPIDPSDPDAPEPDDTVRYDIDTALVGGAGTIDASMTLTPKAQETVNHTVTWQIGKGCELKSVTVKQNGVTRVYTAEEFEAAFGADDSYTFEDVKGSCSIAVELRDVIEYVPPADPIPGVRQYKVTTSIEGAGAITPTTTVNEGDSHVVQWRSDEYAKVVIVYIDGGLSARSRQVVPSSDPVVALASLDGSARLGSHQFQDIRADHDVRVVVLSDDPATDQVDISTATLGGSGKVSGGGTVAKGSSSTVSWKPAPGYHVAEVLVDGVPRTDLLTADSLTFDNVATDHHVAVRFAADDNTGGNGGSDSGNGDNSGEGDSGQNGGSSGDGGGGQGVGGQNQDSDDNADKNGAKEKDDQSKRSASGNAKESDGGGKGDTKLAQTDDASGAAIAFGVFVALSMALMAWIARRRLRVVSSGRRKW